MVTDTKFSINMDSNGKPITPVPHIPVEITCEISMSGEFPDYFIDDKCELDSVYIKNVIMEKLEELFHKWSKNTGDTALSFGYLVSIAELPLQHNRLVSPKIPYAIEIVSHGHIIDAMYFGSDNEFHMVNTSYPAVTSTESFMSQLNGKGLGTPMLAWQLDELCSCGNEFVLRYHPNLASCLNNTQHSKDLKYFILLAVSSVNTYYATCCYDSIRNYREIFSEGTRYLLNNGSIGRIDRDNYQFTNDDTICIFKSIQFDMDFARYNYSMKYPAIYSGFDPFTSGIYFQRNITGESHGIDDAKTILGIIRLVQPDISSVRLVYQSVSSPEYITLMWCNCCNPDQLYCGSDDTTPYTGEHIELYSQIMNALKQEHRITPNTIGYLCNDNYWSVYDTFIHAMTIRVNALINRDASEEVKE